MATIPGASSAKFEIQVTVSQTKVGYVSSIIYYLCEPIMCSKNKPRLTKMIMMINVMMIVMMYGVNGGCDGLMREW